MLEEEREIIVLTTNMLVTLVTKKCIVSLKKMQSSERLTLKFLVSEISILVPNNTFSQMVSSTSLRRLNPACIQRTRTVFL